MVTRDEAQAFTLEGLGAAILIILALYFILQSPVVLTQPTYQHLNVQLAQYGRDALVSMDIEVPANSTLANYTLKSYLKAINKSDLKIPAKMRRDLSAFLPKNTMFNVALHYVNLSGINVTEKNYTSINVSMLILNSDNSSEFITNLDPPEDSITASNFVVIYDDELNQASPFKVNATEMGTTSERVPHLIEVRLELWRV